MPIRSDAHSGDRGCEARGDERQRGAAHSETGRTQWGCQLGGDVRQPFNRLRFRVRTQSISLSLSIYFSPQLQPPNAAASLRNPSADIARNIHQYFVGELCMGMGK